MEMSPEMMKEMCPECRMKMKEMMGGEEMEGDEMEGEDGLPSKKPVSSFDDADKRGMMRIMVGFGKGKTGSKTKK